MAYLGPVHFRQVVEKLADLVKEPLILITQKTLQVGVGQAAIADAEQLIGRRIGVEHLMIEADHHHTIGRFFKNLIEIEV